MYCQRAAKFSGSDEATESEGGSEEGSETGGGSDEGDEAVEE